MRFIPVNCLRSGQRLAKNLMLHNRVLLKKDVLLSDSLIKKIHELGFQGLYIDDDLSKDLVIAGMVSDELRHRASKEVRALFLDTSFQNQARVEFRLKKIETVINEMLDDIYHNRNVMINVVDLRAFDDYTFSHSLNVTILSIVMGSVLKLNKNDLRTLAMGALVHDIGKIMINKSILNKKGKLTDEEYEHIKQHSVLGFDYLSNTGSFSQEIKEAVLSHHERYNGLGYPGALSGEEIPLFSRIISVADVYDAMTSDRPYRRALLPSDSIEYIMGGYNSEFDPAVVAAFIKKVAPYPIGTCVKLSNGECGIVIKNYESSGMRPKIRVIREGKPTAEVIDLVSDSSKLNITVQEVVNL